MDRPATTPDDFYLTPGKTVATADICAPEISTLCHEALSVIRATQEMASLNDIYEPSSFGDWQFESAIMAALNPAATGPLRELSEAHELFGAFHHFQLRWARLGLPVLRLTAEFAAELILREPKTTLQEVSTPFPAFVVSLPRRNSVIPAMFSSTEKMAPCTALFVHMRRGFDTDAHSGESVRKHPNPDEITTSRALTLGPMFATPLRFGSALPWPVALDEEQITTSFALDEGSEVSDLPFGPGLKMGVPFRVGKVLATRLVLNLCLELAQQPLGDPTSDRSSGEEVCPQVWTLGSTLPGFGEHGARGLVAKLATSLAISTGN